MSIQDFQNTLFYINQNNEDVFENQFFVYVRTKSKADMYSRLLADIGFKESHIIYKLDTPILKKYFEYFPISDFIRDYLSVIRKKVNELKAKMDVEKDESEKANGEVMSQIMMIEKHISDIKDAVVELDNINKTTVLPEWDFARTKMLETITTWKIKKTKITSNDEAVKLADQFEEEVKYQWSKFIEVISAVTVENKNTITKKCNEIYDKATRSQTSNISCDTNFETYKSAFDGINVELLKIKEENYEKHRDGFINAFLKEIASANEDKEEVLVTTYPCQRWREYVEQFTNTIIDKIIEERNSEIQEYCKETSMKNMEKLIHLLDEREKDKEDFSKRLSSDIRELQKDSDWLNTFIENLETIERS
ncbi:MAG: hypothetical protein IKS48_08835 [Eubacterium sp.]|nr:hypothetical protein [Eubacterium sp.]